LLLDLIRHKTSWVLLEDELEKGFTFFNRGNPEDCPDDL
jgi:hypothetical protein